MKIKKSHTKKRIIATLLVSAILVVGGVLVYYQLKSDEETSSQASSEQKSSGSTDLNPPSDEVEAAAAETKKASIEANQNTGTNTNGKVDMIVTRANVSGNNLDLSVLIQSVVSSGTCTLRLTSGDQTIVKTAGVQALSSSSTCAGFKVNGLSSGSWKATVTYAGDQLSGSVSTAIEVEG